ncbi:MAG: T9SS type A sorting domain-containing protein [Bacteroidota bacterium]|nr:T9SS type A sorting domain-containing protein [Bacteroidota bacterium]
MRSYNIDASTPFAVGFICEGDSISQPRVMVTEYPSSVSYHSFTYFNEAATPNWYYLSANQAGDTIYIYLIRAYVSFVASDVRNAIELSPASFSLKQNYPNPFNPTTTLSLVIGNSSFVTLKVYDVLGREVATLINEQKSAGSYNFEFRTSSTSGGFDIPSGVYFYRLDAVSTTEPTRTFTEIKKMVVVR